MGSCLVILSGSEKLVNRSTTRKCRLVWCRRRRRTPPSTARRRPLPPPPPREREKRNLQWGIQGPPSNPFPKIGRLLVWNQCRHWQFTETCHGSGIPLQPSINDVRSEAVFPMSMSMLKQASSQLWFEFKIMVAWVWNCCWRERRPTLVFGPCSLRPLVEVVEVEVCRHRRQQRSLDKPH